MDESTKVQMCVDEIACMEMHAGALGWTGIHIHTVSICVSMRLDVYLGVDEST